MAKYTSEKAAKNIGNKFDMILVAATRARELKRGKRTLLTDVHEDIDNVPNQVETIKEHKPTVLALREIEQGKIGREYLRKLRTWERSQATRHTKNKN